MPKLRVDVALVERGLVESREAAQRLIAAGRVRVGTLVLVKASQVVDSDAELSVSEPERYVSRGGLKLEGALAAFGVDPSRGGPAGEGLHCLDLGASTGGFTDCLLQHGAASVLAVDVGRAQLHDKLRRDPRVTLLEGTNARALPALEGTGNRDQGTVGEGRREEGGEGLSIDDRRRSPDGETVVDVDQFAQEEVSSDTEFERSATASAKRPSTFDNRQLPQLFVADLSFISLRKVLPSVAHRLAPGTPGIVLLKPQFEAGPKDVPRGGVIKDEAVLERVRREFLEWLGDNGWHVYGMIASPIRGGDGNTEYLVHLATPVNHGGTEATEILKGHGGPSED